jgi:predicted nucleotidyltransferase
MLKTTDCLAIAQSIAARYAQLPQVKAIALSGSQGFGVADERSDIDLYVYSDAEISLAIRQKIATEFSYHTEIGNQFWEPGDEWIDADHGVAVDVMFRSPQWIEDQLHRVLTHHHASVGYTTCFWHNVKTSHILFDRDGWFGQLQAFAQQPYPEPLRQAIVDKNFPILKTTLSSYFHQIEKAIARQDWVSVNHRIAAVFASYFDVLFAINRMPHPGEKRLVAIAHQHCSKQPPEMAAQVQAVFQAQFSPEGAVLLHLERLISGLEQLLQIEGLLPLSRQRKV